MKIRAMLALVTAAVIVGSAMTLAARFDASRLIPSRPLELLVRSRRFGVSSITLEGMRELSTLATVRYVHRAVFPYDYLPAGVSLDGILRKLRVSRTTVRDTLTADELLYFLAHTLATDVGLSAPGGTFDFVVVSLVLTAGYDLAHAVRAIEIENPAAGGAARRAVVTLGPPVITEIAVEDIRPADYPYPDAALGPDGWRRVAAFVRDEMVPQSVVDELLSTARRNGEQFIQGALGQAGVTTVQFVRAE